ncbi:MAG TPA: hypothetical protein VGB17_19620, partial [Pyrinomonadaceae bacterium]
MPKGNWKSLALLGAVAAVAAILLLLSLASFLKLTVLSWTGFAPWIVLLVLTLGASRFKVSVTNADGFSQSQKTVADTFIFLAAMIYAAPPVGLVGPAVALAAVAGFLSAWPSPDRRNIVFTTGASIISTYVAATLYELLVPLFALDAHAANSEGLTLNALLLPLCVMALVQYFLSTIPTVAFIAFESGRSRLTLSRESLVWTTLTQVACAASAALFYTALRGSGIPSVFVGLLIIFLVYMLYRFNEQHVSEIRRAEAAKAKHIQE